MRLCFTNVCWFCIVLGQFSVVLNWFCFMLGAIPRQMKGWEMFFRPCAAGLSGLNEWTVPEFPVWTGLKKAPMPMGLFFGYGFGSGFCSGRFHSTRVVTPGAQSVFQSCYPAGCDPNRCAQQVPPIPPFSLFRPASAGCPSNLCLAKTSSPSL